jgi:hypothetical protein
LRGHICSTRALNSGLMPFAGTARSPCFRGLLPLRPFIRFHGIPAHQLVEPALLAFGSRFLKYKRQLVLIEFLEPFIPGNLRQRRFRSGWKIDADYAGVVLASCASHTRRLPTPLLRPASDFFMIRGRM